MFRPVAIVGLVVALATSVAAQSASPRTATRQATPVAKPAGMTNDDVVKLAKAGFGDETIISRIGAAPATAFDASVDALIALKEAGVSERVIAVMLGGPDPGPSSSRPAAPEPVASPRTGVVSHEVAMAPPSTTSAEGRQAGIYVRMGDGLRQLEPTVFSGGKTGGVLLSGLTMGIAKAKWKAVVRAPQALQRLEPGRPEFWFYFERQGSGLSHTGINASMFGASSANEFILAKMTRKTRERELIVGEWGAFGGSSGTRSRDTVDITVERVEPGVYRVVPSEPLVPGEYCFFYAAGASAFYAAGAGKLFDFGVDGYVARE